MAAKDVRFAVDARDSVLHGCIRVSQTKTSQNNVLACK